MKCELVKNLMSSYIDKDLNEIDKSAFEKHIQQCSECREEYELLLEIVTESNNIEEAELPEDFHESLHQKLLDEKQNSTNKLFGFINKYKWKAASGLAAAVLVIAIAINGNTLLSRNYKAQDNIASESKPAAENGMVGSYGNYADSGAGADLNKKAVQFDKDTSAPTISAVTPADTSQLAVTFGEAISAEGAANNFAIASDDSQMPSRSGRKVMRSGNLSIKVADLDAKVNDIKTIAESSGGYVENSQVSNNGGDVVKPLNEDKKQTVTIKTANMVIRVPEEQFDTIYDNIKNMGETENENITGKDITLQYNDTEAALTNLKLKEQKLQDLMTTKANTVDDILKIENELNNVRTSIDTLTGNLKTWDNLIQLSTIYVNLTESKTTILEPVNMPGIWTQSKQGFIKTINNIGKWLQSLFVFIIGSLPLILIFGIPLIVMIIIIRRKVKVQQ